MLVMILAVSCLIALVSVGIRVPMAMAGSFYGGLAACVGVGLIVASTSTSRWNEAGKAK